MRLFGIKDQDRVGEERLARLLSERPQRTIAVAPIVAPPARDLARALVINLLLAAVVGTWTVAFLLE